MGMGEHIHSFPASVEFHRILITFENSLDPDQARRSGSKLFDALIIS